MDAKTKAWIDSRKIDRSARNAEYINDVSKRVLGFYADQDKKNRKSKHLCKFCHYYDNARIGGCAMTPCNCTACNKEMIFSNTCTDLYCDECAESLKVCKHCGARMD